jgi:hypothetical protein
MYAGGHEGNRRFSGLRERAYGGQYEAVDQAVFHQPLANPSALKQAQ